jgi:TolA-binding protein
VKYLIALFGISAFLLMYSGCANITVLRVQEIKALEAHVDSLFKELHALQQKMMEEEKKQNEMLRLLRADQQVHFTEIERNVQALAGNVSESQDRLSKIDEKTREIKKRWEERARTDSVADANMSAEMENLFKIAYNDFIAGRYDVSFNGFQDLMIKFPDSQFAEQALYWSAECYYVQKKYEEAEKVYKEYLKKYKEGEKICVTLYKLGLVYDKRRKKKSRKIVWNKLLKQCPDSDEAKAVKRKM